MYSIWHALLFAFRKQKVLVVISLLLLFEIGYRVFQYNYGKIHPAEFRLLVPNILARDLIVYFLAILIIFNHNKLYEYFFRRPYLPCLLTGLVYTFIFFRNTQLVSLDYGVLTALSFLYGLVINTMIVILVALIYERTKNKWWFGIYLFTYLFYNILLVSDAIYFQFTSTHIEENLFENFNIYSVNAVLANSGVLEILVPLLGVSVLLFTFIHFVKLDTPRKNRIGIAAGICLTVWLVNLSAVFLYNEVAQRNSEFQAKLELSREVHRDQLTESVLGNLFSQIVNYYSKDSVAVAVSNPIPLTQEEAAALKSLGIVKTINSEPVSHKSSYDRVVMIVLESLSRDFIHYYNPAIPAQATSFFDTLLAQNAKLNKYYTSNMPTPYGLNATLKSRLSFDDSKSSVFSILEDNGYDNYFIESSSKFYEDIGTDWPRMFLFPKNRMLAKEDLQKRYSGASGWGFHDDVLYKETIRLLKENRNKKISILTNSLDLHLPAYYGIPDNELPPIIGESPYRTIKSLYWTDRMLQDFFRALENEGLFDEKTLIIITTDHNPNPGGDYRQLVKGEGYARLAPIPLIFVTQSGTIKIDENQFSSQIDFAPTLMSILGLKSSSDFIGRDLTSAPKSKDFALGMYGSVIYYKSRDFSFAADTMSETENKDIRIRAVLKWFRNGYRF